MRIGQNPSKRNIDIKPYPLHHIIIPVYIPSVEGYFKYSIEVLNLCLNSLMISKEENMQISIVSNGCCQEVENILVKRYNEGWFQQLIINKENMGKIDALMSVARGSFSRLITFSDGDVLFKYGWLNAIESIYNIFPEAGFVSPFPSVGSMWYCASATMLGAFCNREIICASVVSSSDMDRFSKSIGRPDLYSEKDRKNQLVVRRNGKMALIGAGHFIATLRREVIDAMPKHASLKKILGNSEVEWLDIPPDKTGYWRLSTVKAHVHHIGNTPETWMYEELEEMRRTKREVITEKEIIPKYKKTIISRLPLSVRNKIVGVIRRIGIFQK